MSSDVHFQHLIPHAQDNERHLPQLCTSLSRLTWPWPQYAPIWSSTSSNLFSAHLAPPPMKRAQLLQLSAPCVVLKYPTLTEMIMYCVAVGGPDTRKSFSDYNIKTKGAIYPRCFFQLEENKQPLQTKNLTEIVNKEQNCIGFVELLAVFWNQKVLPPYLKFWFDFWQSCEWRRQFSIFDAQAFLQASQSWQTHLEEKRTNLTWAL